MKNRIALFEWTPRSAMAWIILIATGCQFSHAAIEINGTWHDASESRGTFSPADITRLQGRPCQICDFDGDLAEWLQTMRGKRYDYKGAIGWLLCRWLKRGCGDKHKFYCFEAANGALQAAGYRGASQAALSGCDLRNALPAAPRYKIFGENP